ncbi:formate/nitrite transporter family protein [Limimaricola hongkongensis]|uniref:Putative transport n=1 Tax=Limimaricola hongkongensis DSM 17492 TaxID=1122180 RepID=A0A017HHK4_9RHOB|nr:formate/nitrite transporter family protein [Limimaricola hongkongensis]EYD73274.1 Putative transport [Limimaricola hongkongensis DSM 17492]
MTDAHRSTDKDRTAPAQPRESAPTAKVRSHQEDEAVSRAGHLSPRLVYHVVLRAGEEELMRPTSSLVFSGIAAGMLISMSVLAEAVFRAYLPEAGWRPLVENIGYTIGFLLVILSRMQLFTENTITTVLPLLTRPGPRCARGLARLWGIVLGANLIGCFAAAAFYALTQAIPPEVAAAMAELSHHATGAGAAAGFAKAIPAGILIAALVWMLSSGDQEHFWIIFIFTWLIAAGDFTHIVAGAVEMAYLLILGELAPGPAILSFFLPVLAGNVVGGTVVFTLTAWGQVREEIAPDTAQTRADDRRAR